MLRIMSLTMLGWRREVTALYARVRSENDPRSAWQLWRNGRDRLFRDHPDSPIAAGQRAGFDGLRFADYDPGLRWTLPLEPADPLRIDVTTGTDGVVGFERFGIIRLPELGSLDVWWHTGYGGGVFVPVRDGTAGSTSYGGGRYLLDTVKGADLGGGDGRLTIDLNFAYNPSCAYDEAWACPLAPPGNQLPVPIRAGELDYRPASA
jgi:uncharacterized protein